jgi:hypothetical protein
VGDDDRARRGRGEFSRVGRAGDGILAAPWHGLAGVAAGIGRGVVALPFITLHIGGSARVGLGVAGEIRDTGEGRRGDESADREDEISGAARPAVIDRGRGKGDPAIVC